MNTIKINGIRTVFRITFFIFVLFWHFIQVSNLYAYEDYDQEEEGVDIIYLSHRYIGYSILALAVLNGALGYYIINLYEKGERVPSYSRYVHKRLGVGIAGLSILQSALGYIEFWKLRKEEGGSRRRFIHMILSTVATAGFIAATLFGEDARERIEKGRASSIAGSYLNHMTVGLLSISLVFTTAIIIAW